jgi:malate dehydrogenase
MGFIAIVGSGALGGAVAHALAVRDRVGEVRLIDGAGNPAGSVARGKALDILQSSPVDNFSTRVTSADTIEAAVGAEVVVIADPSSGSSEHTGDAGLGIIRQLERAGNSAPMVCAGATQRDLIHKSVSELHVPRARILGSAPFALESALRALAGIVIDGSGVEVSLRVVGTPPHGAVVAWEEATAFGQPLSSQMPAHAIAGLSARIPSLWPPGPYALAAAASRVVEAIVTGSRRRFSCFVTVGTGQPAVCAMPVQLGTSGVTQVHEPSLTRQERTLVENALARG